MNIEITGANVAVADIDLANWIIKCGYGVQGISSTDGNVKFLFKRSEDLFNDISKFSSNDTYIVYSIKAMNYLVRKGHAFIGVEDNKNVNGKYVFRFRDTKKLRDDLNKFVKYNKASGENNNNAWGR